MKNRYALYFDLGFLLIVSWKTGIWLDTFLYPSATLLGWASVVFLLWPFPILYYIQMSRKDSKYALLFCGGQIGTACWLVLAAGYLFSGQWDIRQLLYFSENIYGLLFTAVGMAMMITASGQKREGCRKMGIFLKNREKEKKTSKEKSGDKGR